MSYDLRIVPASDVEARAALAAAGVEVDGDEGVLVRGDLVAQFLVSGDEVGVGITGDGDSDAFRSLLDVVLGVAEALEAEVLDEQIGGGVDRGNAEEAVRAFGG